MRARWRSLLVPLLVAEVLLAWWIVHIQPRCEPCLPGGPCPPCMSDDQRRWMAVAGLLPVAVVLLQLLRVRMERRKQ